MSSAELFFEIERLRAHMYSLSDFNADYSELLKVSQELDRLIILYYKALS
ncbi:hypothetical protein DCCM_3638 [Desulfocucumis palustris]|uniref:Spo0E like sporulation regulatory protein n=1 Tax=Desulfocucumis palustris TaxID=1898651 RepID=A0A2L2XED0_9FIRM|nr:aspartyl-phosphate phosphatase Spo0E family protein [Desulfocucumis palustris]GBF34520.1 hypothetical protein DCCM_3638 [Desulfocucumis palustris]